MRLVLLIFLALVCGQASAIPLVGIAASFIGGTAFTIGAVAVTWGTVVFTAASLLYGAATQRKQKKEAAAAAQRQVDSFNAGLRSRTISGVATEFPYRFIYGKDRVGVNTVAVFTSGPRDEYKHIVAEFAACETTAIDEIYVNGKAVGPLDVNGSPTAGPFIRGDAFAGYDTSPVATFSLTHADPNVPNMRTFGDFINSEGFREARALPFTYNAGLNQVTVDVSGYPDITFVLFTVTYSYVVITPMIRIRKHFGTPTDPVDPVLNIELPSKWPATAVLRGHSYVYILINLNLAEFQGGLPQIELVVRGKPVYDVRTGITAWSENNALIAYDYLTSVLGGVKPTSLQLASFIAAANDCDDVVSTGSWSGKRYTFNGSITSDQPREEVLEKIAQSMAGGIDATTWRIYAGKISASVMSIGQADIVGEIGISPGLPLGDVFNTVKGQFVSPENGYVATDYKPYQNPTYLDIDGEELATNIDLPFTNSQQRCTNLARIFTEDSRNSFTISGKFSLKTWKLQVGDRVTFTSAFFGQSSKLFRVTDKSFAPDRMVQLSLKEDAESIYDLADETEPDATPNTDLPNPFVIEPLLNMACESGDAQLLIQEDGTIVSRILVTWSQSTSPGVLQNGTIDVEFQKVGDVDWQKIEVAGTETAAFLSPVEDGQFYFVRARGVNPYLNVQGDWSYPPIHQVIGKTQPPPDVLSFTVLGQTFTWGPVFANDLAGYEIRFNFGQNTAWGTGTPLHTGLITESPWTPLVFPSGPITVMVKAIDTSGNESANAASIQTNLGDPIVANLIQVYDDKAAGFAGSVVNGSVSGGNMVAHDSGDLFWGADGANFWGQDAALFWPASTYLQMVYTLSYNVTANEVGSRLTLLTDIIAESYTIEYRFGTQGLFWGPDDDFFWGLDADLFWPQPTEWQTWPGGIDAITEGEIEFRITTQAGSVQGSINELTLQFDVEDETEFINDVAISALGTRLPLTKSYREIKNVQLTLQTAPGGADHAETADKLATGPLVYTKNGPTLTTGLVDAFIQGVKGL